MDPTRFKLEIFVNKEGEMMTKSLLAMADSIKKKASTPLQ